MTQRVRRYRELEQRQAAIGDQLRRLTEEWTALEKERMDLALELTPQEVGDVCLGGRLIRHP